MLIGHIGVGLAAKKVDSRIPLWVLLVAALFVDLINCFFLFAGVEIVRVAPGFTRWVPLELVSIPYSHSLAMGTAWAIVFSAGAFVLIRQKQMEQGMKAVILLGALVFVHFFCDALVHVKDLTLWPGSVKLGLGLWNYPVISNAIEITLFAGGLALYLQARGGNQKRSAAIVIAFALIQISLQIASGFVPPYTTDVAVVSANLLVTFLVLIGLGWLLERKLDSAAR